MKKERFITILNTTTKNPAPETPSKTYQIMGDNTLLTPQVQQNKSAHAEMV